MHTGYVPNPTIEHPGYGSVVSHELASHVSGLQIPPFVSVGGGSVGPGFLGMTYAAIRSRFQWRRSQCCDHAQGKIAWLTSGWKCWPRI